MRLLGLMAETPDRFFAVEVVLLFRMIIILIRDPEGVSTDRSLSHSAASAPGRQCQALTP